MAVKVNPPPQLRIPQRFQNDPEVFNFFKSQGQILFQLWQRTGGNKDLVDENEQTLTSAGSRVNRNAAKINSLELKEFEILTVDADITTNRNQILICKNAGSITITLDDEAIEEDEVHIKRRGSEVNIVGTIDGDSDLTLNVERYSVHLVFDGLDWSVI